MLTLTELDERQKVKDREKEIEKIAGGCVCSVCGGGLRAPWDATTGQIELRCSRDKTHTGHVWPDREIDRLMEMRVKLFETGKDTQIIDLELQRLIARKQIKKGVAMQEESIALAEYKRKGIITQETAMEIIRTTPGWGSAPANVVKRASMVCADYRLYPGIHVFLIAFNAGKTNESWVVVQGIKSNRLLASRKKAYSYTDGPRIATEQEAKDHYQEEYNKELIYAVCRGKGVDGSEAEAWGTWRRADVPYGIDKGNSKANMAEIRAERRFLDRLCPGEMPTGIDVIDESYVSQAQPDATVSEIDPVSGEVIEGEAREVPEWVPPDFSKSETATPEPETPTPAPEPPKDKPPAVAASRKMSKDAGSFSPINTADLVGASSYYFGMKVDEVTALLGGTIPVEPEAIADAWLAIIGEKMKV